MLSIVLCSLLVVIVTITVALDLQHEDLNDPTKPCGVQRASCDARKSADRSRNITLRNCMCDAACATYGDCCVDSPYFDDAEQRRAVTQFNCMQYDDLGSYYVKQSCPASYAVTEIRRKCEKSSHVNLRDPLVMTPVTDRRDNVTYGNVFCAVCNGRSLASPHLDVWKIGLRCPSNSPRVYPVNDRLLLDRITFDEKDNFWKLFDDNQTFLCSFRLVIPERLKQRLAACHHNMTKTCPATWIHEPQPQPHQQQIRGNASSTSSSSSSAIANRESIRVSCESYTMVVYQNPDTLGHQPYRNVHCAICNSVRVQDLQCEDKRLVDVRAPFDSADVPSFTILFDFMGNQSRNCGPGRVYDGLLKTCRDDIADQSALAPSECPRLISVETNFSFVNDADDVFVPHHNRTYQFGQYVYHRDNNSVALCRRSGGGDDDEPPRYPIHFRIISAVGIGVSIVCLLAHLVAFVLLKDLRNLSGKNLASLCLALLVAYTSFALANALDSTACLVNAVTTYYFFLAAFAWMLIMSFDVWRSLKIATKELRVSHGKQWRKFFIYSACGWLVPAKFALVALLVDLCPVGESAQRFQPNFGRNACWFNNGHALLLFFILPVFVTLVCNVCFFVFSAVMIYSSHSMTRYSASPATKRDFRLYARLSLIMGLTWITGLVAGLANNNAVWILFITSNAFLGLFIFLAFTWRKAVLHGLQNLKRDSVLNLPAFSWSVNTSSSGDSKTQPRNGDRQTSNTYY